MPRTGEQLERVRARSRESLRLAAEQLFARHGYAHTSVRMIADRAGVSQGLLYNYFDGKAGLLRAIFEHSMSEVEADLAGMRAPGSPGEALARLVRSAFERLRTNPDFWSITYQIRMQPEVLAELGGAVGAWTAVIVGEIERQLRRASVPHAAAHARLLFAAIDGAAQHYVLDPETYPLDAVADATVALLVPGADTGSAGGGGKETQ